MAPGVPDERLCRSPARRSRRPATRRAEAALEVGTQEGAAGKHLVSTGDDYGYGYEPAVDVLGFGPPIGLTQNRHTEYHFRYFTLAGCAAAADCDDGLFCNGQESCLVTGCGPGVFPCDDSEPCTTDTCDEDLDECSNVWVPAPDEVTGLALAPESPGSSTATLSWSAVVDAEWYRVYRGEQCDLGDLACFDGHVSGTSVDDDGTVAASGLYCFLTTAVHCGLESTLGVDSDGDPRPDPPTCP